MRIAYQGEPGAFSEAAARRVAPDAQLLACRSFEEAFAAVEAARPTTAVVPIENSIGGSIHRNYDLLLEHELPIVGEVELPVVHHLLALPGATLERLTARLLASAGAGAVRAVPADADRRRDRRHLRHRPAAPRWWPTSSSTDAAAIASARAGEVFGLTPLAVGDPGLRRQHHALPRHRPRGRCRDSVARQDVDRVLAAERAGRAVQGAERVRAARHRSDEARVAADSGPALGIPVLRRPRRRRATSCRARARWRIWPSSRRCCARSARTPAGRRAESRLPDPFEVRVMTFVPNPLTTGPSRAPARAMLKAVGFTDADLKKPLIGVANTWIEIGPCNYHLRELAGAREGRHPRRRRHADGVQHGRRSPTASRWAPRA